MQKAYTPRTLITTGQQVGDDPFFSGLQGCRTHVAPDVVLLNPALTYTLLNIC